MQLMACSWALCGLCCRQRHSLKQGTTSWRDDLILNSIVIVPLGFSNCIAEEIFLIWELRAGVDTRNRCL